MSTTIHNLRSVRDTRLDYEELIERRDADALIDRIRLERLARWKHTNIEDERRKAMASIILGGYVRPDKKFGSILFHKLKSNRDQSFVAARPNPQNTFDESRWLTVGPFLELHLDPTTLGSARADMRQASKWLAQEAVREKYPVVIGCTFRELARTAGHFGLKEALPVYVHPQYMNSVHDAHRAFLMMNDKPLDTPCFTEAVYAETPQLAKVWADI